MTTENPTPRECGERQNLPALATLMSAPQRYGAGWLQMEGQASLNYRALEWLIPEIQFVGCESYEGGLLQRSLWARFANWCSNLRQAGLEPLLVQFQLPECKCIEIEEIPAPRLQAIAAAIGRAVGHARLPHLTIVLDATWSSGPGFGVSLIGMEGTSAGGHAVASHTVLNMVAELAPWLTGIQRLALHVDPALLLHPDVS